MTFLGREVPFGAVGIGAVSTDPGGPRLQFHTLAENSEESVLNLNHIGTDGKVSFHRMSGLSGDLWSNAFLLEAFMGRLLQNKA